MAGAWTRVKKQEDNINCPSCLEVFNDPRVLPCSHTYCLRCIDGWCQGSRPGDDVVCPLCMEQFIIPTSGVSGLPKNFFVMELLNLKEMYSSQSSKQSPCEARLDAKDDSETEVKSASVNCTAECREKLCEDRDRTHGKRRATRVRNKVPLRKGNRADESDPKYSSTYCDMHPTEYLKLYCVECKVAICTTCYTEQHHSHTCSDIDKVAGECLEKTKRNSGRITGGIEKCGDLVNKLREERLSIVQRINDVEKEIGYKADELKEAIENHKQQMLDELGAFREKSLKDFDRVRSDIERHLLSLRGLKKCIDEVLKEGGAVCDIVRTAGSLHDTAEELLTFDPIKRAWGEMVRDYVSFTPSTTSLDDVRKCFGEIIVPAAKHVVVSSSHLVPTQTHIQTQYVRAMTSLSNQLFVVSGSTLLSSVNTINVYNFDITTLQYKIDFPKLAGRNIGLVACGLDNRLYVSCDKNKTVTGVTISRGNVKEQWSLAQEPTGLSLTSTNTLLVACDSDNLLLEYNRSGDLVRKMRLEGGVNPRHAVKLASDQFLVCKRQSPSDVYIVGTDGRVIRSYEQSATQVGLLMSPTSLIVTQTGLIIVADFKSNRIVTMDQSLSDGRELHLPQETRLKSIHAMCLDESRGRLFVACAENRETTVLVFNNINFT